MTVSMSILDSFRLPPDLVMFPAAELADELRQKVDCADRDYVLTRPRARTPSKVIDPESAELLAQFKEPKQIIDAVVSFSAATGRDPEATLEVCFPLLRDLIESGFLVASDSELADVIEASLRPADVLSGFSISEIIQVLEDTELYRADADDGSTVAIKLARPGYEKRVTALLRREASLLDELDGRVNPRLVERGELSGRPYLALEWCAGERATSAAARIRRSRGAQSRELLSLCLNVAGAYAHLHDQAVIHGDVHPGNVLVLPDLSVTIIDFGFARVDRPESEYAKAPRGGIARYFEPEYTAAYLRRRAIPRATAVGEQYALAALLYNLLTGAEYLDFSAEKRAMYEQIAHEPPRPFAEHGLLPWPSVEAVLAKSLSKEPLERFQSVAELAEALRTAGTESGTGARSGQPEPALRSSTLAADLARSVRILLESPRLDSFVRAPMCSVNYGLAGIAYALYRMAYVQNDSALLASADACAQRAILSSGGEEAFVNNEIGITPKIVGSISAYHTASGVFAVRALVSHAMGDFASQNAALRDFVVSSAHPCDNLDVTLGRSSTLLACSLLLDVTPPNGLVDSAPIVALGTTTMNEIWQTLERMPPIPECIEFPLLGIAHGWAGFLYATLRWCCASRTTLPASFRERLDELAACGEQMGRGLRWRRKIGAGERARSHDFMPGWCNGSAGFVHLWALAHEALGEDVFATLAEGAAWNAWDSEEAIPNLCCGTAGRSYALLTMYRRSGEGKWLNRARKLAEISTAGAEQLANAAESPRYSLYKGRLGIESLLIDLLEPEGAAMPFFEAEGW